MTQPLPVSPAHALCVYTEPLATGRRVVVVGDATLGLGERLVDLGARVVHVYDPDGGRARRAPSSRSLSVRELPTSEFDVREGAFDVALVPDLGSVPDPAGLLLRLRKLLADGGALVVAARNPESSSSSGGARSIDYYELYELVSLQFASVRMVGQMPFRGVALAELGESDESPQVAVDTQLVVASDPPELFIAVASQRGTSLDSYALIQLPDDSFGPVEMDTRASPTPRDDDRAGLQQAELAAAVLRAEALETQLAEVRGRLSDSQRRSERLLQDAQILEDEREQLRTLLSARESSANNAAEVSLEAARAVEERIGQALAVAEERMVQALAVAEARTLQVDRLEAELAVVGEAHAEELAQLEAVLRERARHLQSLEAELVRRERLVRELVASVEEARQGEGGDEGQAILVAAAERSAAEAQALRESLAARSREVAAAVHARDAASTQVRTAVQERDRAMAEIATLRERLDAQALDAAQREAELQTRGWRIAELDAELALVRGDTAKSDAGLDAPTVSARDAAVTLDLTEQLARAQDELRALRQALAQEHEARAQAEAALGGTPRA